MPKLNPILRDVSREYISVRAPITQVTQQVWLPCWPIPLCNSLTTAQILWLSQAIQTEIATNYNPVSSDANNLITRGTDGKALLTSTMFNTAITNSSAFTTLNNDIDAVEAVNATQTTNITNLTTRVTTAEADIDAVEAVNAIQTTNITNLTTRVTDTETVNATQTTNITNLTTSVTTAETDIDALQLNSHVPAIITGNGIVTSVPSGVDNQTFQLGINIGQLPSTDSNNSISLGADGKLYVAQAIIATSGFNTVTTIALRDAQTVLDGHITHVTNNTPASENGFYIYDSANSLRTNLVPNATVISVNGKTGSVVLIPSDITYVNTIGGLAVTNIQEALDQLVSLQNSLNANNWLDKNGTNIVLGQDVWEAGDPAKLLSDREIPLNGSNLSLKNAGGEFRFEGDGNVFFTNVPAIPVLSTAVPLGIVEATGQIGRVTSKSYPTSRISLPGYTLTAADYIGNSWIQANYNKVLSWGTFNLTAPNPGKKWMVTARYQISMDSNSPRDHTASHYTFALISGIGSAGEDKRFIPESMPAKSDFWPTVNSSTFTFDTTASTVTIDVLCQYWAMDSVKTTPTWLAFWYTEVSAIEVPL